MTSRVFAFAICGWLGSGCALGAGARPSSATTTAPSEATRPALVAAFRTHVDLPPRTVDQNGVAFDVRGLSGITWAGGDTCWAVMDNSDKLVRIECALRPDGSVTSANITGGLTIADKRDFEGIAFTSRERNSVFVSEENTPGVHEYSLADGRRLRSLETPAVFLRGSVVRNRGFEALAMTPDGRSIWTANEHALTVDGSPGTYVEPIGSTSRIRLLRYAAGADGTFAPAEQRAYQTSAVHELAGFNSLADLAALPDGRLLALERSAGKNLAGAPSIRTRLFIVDPASAMDVSRPPFDRGMAESPTTSPASSRPAFRPLRAGVTTARKTLVFDGLVCDQDGENLEGICLGPQLGPDRWAVLGVVDDGDGSLNVSRTRLVSFEIRLETARE